MVFLQHLLLRPFFENHLWLPSEHHSLYPAHPHLADLHRLSRFQTRTTCRLAGFCDVLPVAAKSLSIERRLNRFSPLFDIAVQMNISVTGRKHLSGSRDQGTRILSGGLSSRRRGRSSLRQWILEFHCRRQRPIRDVLQGLEATVPFSSRSVAFATTSQSLPSLYPLHSFRPKISSSDAENDRLRI